MNARQIHYAMEVAKSRSFSAAAERLNISQPSLSKQIQNLETELGVKLFDRSTVTMKLTPAGEYFLHQAQALLYQGGQLVRSMEDFKTENKGRLTIGVSPFRNLFLMPQIVEKIKEEYPDIEIRLREMPSNQLRKEAEAGSFDFAIVNLPVNEAVLDVIYLEPEHLAVAVPYKMLPLIKCEDPAQSAEVDFSCFSEVPFVVVAQSQEMRRYFDSLCASYHVTPKVAVEVAGGVTSAWAMAQAGLGATLLPRRLLEGTVFGDNLALFTIRDPAYARQPVIVTRRGQYIPKYAHYAMELLQNTVKKSSEEPSEQLF